jgi:hypothetical protein
MKQRAVLVDDPSILVVTPPGHTRIRAPGWPATGSRRLHEPRTRRAHCAACDSPRGPWRDGPADAPRPARHPPAGLLRRCGHSGRRCPRAQPSLMIEIADGRGCSAVPSMPIPQATARKARKCGTLA